MSFIVGPALQSFRQLFPTAVKVIGKPGAPIKSPITFGQKAKNIIGKRGGLIGGAGAGASTIPQQVGLVATKKGVSTVAKDITRNVAITGLSAAAISGLVTLTPTGQQVAKDAGTIGKDVSGFVREQSGLVALFLLIGAGALLLGAIKK